MKDIILNKMPVLTWRWLKMNETALSVPSETSTAKIKVLNENANNELSNENIEKMTVLPTGMGESMSELMSEGSENIIINTLAGQVSKNHISICRDKENLAKVRVYIYAAKDSDVRVWMDYASNEENSGALAVQTFVFAENNAKVRLYQAGLQSDSDISLNDIGASVDKYASFELVQLLLGGNKIFAGARTSLVGKRSEFESDLGYYGKAKDQIDLNYVADHIAKSSKSKMITSGVLNDNSSKLLRGTIDFKRGAKEAVGEESEDVLLLGQDIHNQSIPIILCAEEDVVGTHGASIGNLDEEMLFYLTSRGMDKESVTRMVARARIDAIGKKLENVTLEEKINVYLGGSEDEQERI